MIITTDSPRFDGTVPNFKGQLYTHQRQALYQMIRMEFNKEVNGLNTNFALYGDPMGTGKTFTLSALALMDYTVPLKSTLSVGSYMNYTYCDVINSTLIFAEITVFNQWKQFFKDNIDTEIFIIENAYNIRKFLKLQEYPKIILIKNGKYTCNIKHNNITYSRDKIYNLFARLPFRWNRVIIDDYDLSILPNNFVSIKTPFHWLVSSTYNKKRIAKCRIGPDSPSINIYKYPKNCIIKSDISYIQSIINQYNINYRFVCVQNVQDALISHIKEISSSSMENINGNNVDLASLFQKIIGTNIKNYKLAKQQMVEMEEEKEENTDEYIRCKMIITRAENNIQRIKDRMGECVICYDEFEKNHMILLCCGVIICCNCIDKLIKFHKKCPHCRQNMDRNNLVYMPMSIDDMETMDIDDIKENPSVDYQNNKLDALNGILNDAIKYNTFRANINNVQIGIRNQLNDGIKKIIVVSKSNSTLHKLRGKFKNVYTIQGRPNQITKIIENFKKDNNSAILFLNGMNHSAGLNLEFVTDIVFMHKIINHSIETQIIGRGQRIGRYCSLNVWYILFENEIKYMQSLNDIYYF